MPLAGKENGHADGDNHRFSYSASQQGNWTEVLFRAPRLPRRSACRSLRCSLVLSLTSSCPLQVSRSRSYAPDLDDVGHFLKYECQAVDIATGQPIGALQSLQMPQRVISAPQPLLRRMVGIVPDAERVGRFTVLSYNVLADLYASVRAPQRVSDFPFPLPYGSQASSPSATDSLPPAYPRSQSACTSTDLCPRPDPAPLPW